MSNYMDKWDFSTVYLRNIPQILYESKGELFQKVLDMPFSEFAYYIKIENKKAVSFP